MPNDDKENNVNVTFTLPKDIATWLNKKSVREDLNRSQIARKIFRAEMNREKLGMPKPNKAKKEA